LSRRILFVVDSLFPLGDAYQLRILAEGLALQHDVCICVTGSTDPRDSSGLAPPDVAIHFLSWDQKLKHRAAAAQVQVALRLRKRVRAFEPDIVHAFGQRATSIAAATLMAMKARPETKLVSSVLSSWLPQTASVQCFEGFLIKRVDHFLVAHPSLQKDLIDLDIATDNISILSNSVNKGTARDGETEVADQQRQQRRASLIEVTGIEPTAFIAVTSADLEPMTRLKDLIWATDLLSCVRDDVHLVILGAGSQQKRLRMFAECTEASPHVHFAGRPSTALEMLGASDVYWNSHLRTPLPSSLMAAMNFGVPVISVYGPQTEQLIRHQETGFAVNFGARDEFARWTKFLIEKPDAAKQLAWQGQQHVRREFESEGAISDVEKIYEVELGR